MRKNNLFVVLILALFPLLSTAQPAAAPAVVASGEASLVKPNQAITKPESQDPTHAATAIPVKKENLLPEQPKALAQNSNFNAFQQAVMNTNAMSPRGDAIAALSSILYMFNNPRTITALRWPTDDQLLDGANAAQFQAKIKQAKPQEMGTIKKELNKICSVVSSNYDNFLTKEYKTAPGKWNLDIVCEIIYRDTEKMIYPFEMMYSTDLMIYRMNAFVLLNHIMTDTSESSQISIFSMLRLPPKYHTLITEVLLLISLGLVGFLTFKQYKG